MPIETRTLSVAVYSHGAMTMARLDILRSSSDARSSSAHTAASSRLRRSSGNPSTTAHLLRTHPLYKTSLVTRGRSKTPGRSIDQQYRQRWKCGTKPSVKLRSCQTIVVMPRYKKQHQNVSKRCFLKRGSPLIHRFRRLDPVQNRLTAHPWAPFHHQGRQVLQ